MISLKDLENASKKIISSVSEIPGELLEVLESGGTRNGGSHFVEGDLLPAIIHGKEWLYEYTAKFQPETAKILLDGSSLMLRANDSYSWFLIQEVQGAIVRLFRRPFGKNPDDKSYHDRIERIKARQVELHGEDGANPVIERHKSLPHEISAAYYTRLDGLSLPDSTIFGIGTRLLPIPISRPWRSISNILEYSITKQTLDEAMRVVYEQIPEISKDDIPQVDTDLMAFLQRGKVLKGDEIKADVLLVKNNVQDKKVYYIKDGDYFNIGTLENPSEAIDQYCAHVLSHKGEQFDFAPWKSGL